MNLLAEKFIGWNLYQYVHNNSINPTGMSVDEINEKIDEAKFSESNDAIFGKQKKTIGVRVKGYELKNEKGEKK